ncbi:MAG: transposase [Sulfurimonas sp.]|nr:transposase [Sulfurimonas sp.]
MKFSFFLGVDISKSTLDVTIYCEKDYKKSKHIEVNNDIKGFKEILKWLKGQKINVKEVLFCMEHTGIYGLELFVFLEEENLSYSVVSPLEIKRSIGLNRGKNDKVDSLKIARYCYLHAKELKLSTLPSKNLQQLKLLLNERTRIVKMQTVEKQTMTEFKKISSDSSVNRSMKRQVAFKEQITEIEDEMKNLINKNESLKKNYNLATSVIGIGLINAVVFIVYSNNFEGFTDGRKFACYTGVAPFEYSSGTSIKGKTRVSHLANKKIKTNLTQAAKSAVQYDSELRIYYNRKAKEGKEHGVIMNAIKFKLILRVFATVKRGTPFVKMRHAG